MKAWQSFFLGSRIRWFFFYFSISSAVVADTAVLRTWTSQSGTTVDASFVNESTGFVILKKSDGVNLKIALSALSEADQQYVAGIRVQNISTSAVASSTTMSSSSISLQIGGQTVIPGDRIEFIAPLTAEQKKLAEEDHNPAVAEAVVALAVPKNFDPTKSYPLLIVSATTDGDASSTKNMNMYWPTAVERGWVVMAADGPGKTKPPSDHTGWRWAMIGAGLDALHAAWPGSQNWPIAAGGFSGGAKRSGLIGALLVEGDNHVIGLFMGGCNQDTATLGLQKYRPKQSAFLSVPIFISSGVDDKTATVADAQRMKSNMERTHFKNVRLETYTGGHSLDSGHVAMALDWFLKESGVAQ